MLKDAYIFDQKMRDVFNQGVALIQPNSPGYNTLNLELASAAEAGKDEFTITIAHNVNNDYLELKGAYMETYFSGISSALLNEGFYSYEFTVTLNTQDVSVAAVDINFTL